MPLSEAFSRDAQNLFRGGDFNDFRRSSDNSPFRGVIVEQQTGFAVSDVGPVPVVGRALHTNVALKIGDKFHDAAGQEFVVRSREATTGVHTYAIDVVASTD